jgi:heptosyltransferase-1/heptosyltransferase-2
VVAPTSRWPSKRWPEDRFVAVARHLIDRKLKVIVVGGPDEREQCPRLLDLCRRDQRVIDRIGRTSIGGLMAIIERCDLLIANDSAALHIGVGFGRKLIGLYGPTRIERVGPYRRQRDVIQYLREDDDLQHKRDVNVSLMERIPVEEVVDRADSLLAEPKARRRD